VNQREIMCVIPYGVPNNPKAIAEAIRAGNCVRTCIHGSTLPPFRPLGMRIHFHEDGSVTWEYWDGREGGEP